MKKIYLKITANIHRNELPLPYKNYYRFAQYKRPYNSIKKYVDIKGSVLDWGAGNGHFSYYMMKTTEYMITSYAFSRNQLLNEVEKAGNICKIAETLPDGNPAETVKLPFPSSSFDTIFSCGVLEHVHQTGGDQLESIREIYRCTKFNGYFIIFHLPNSLSILQNISSNTHDRKFSRKQIKRFAQESGFKLIECYRYNVLPRNILSKIGADYLGDTPLIYVPLNIFDRLLEYVIPFIATNWFVVLKK